MRLEVLGLGPEEEEEEPFPPLAVVLSSAEFKSTGNPMGAGGRAASAGSNKPKIRGSEVEAHTTGREVELEAAAAVVGVGAPLVVRLSGDTAAAAAAEALSVKMGSGEAAKRESKFGGKSNGQCTTKTGSGAVAVLELMNRSANAAGALEIAAAGGGKRAANCDGGGSGHRNMQGGAASNRNARRIVAAATSPNCLLVLPLSEEEEESGPSVGL